MSPGDSPPSTSGKFSGVLPSIATCDYNDCTAI
jgi:hypothetical protein